MILPMIRVARYVSETQQTNEKEGEEGEEKERGKEAQGFDTGSHYRSLDLTVEFNFDNG